MATSEVLNKTEQADPLCPSSTEQPNPQLLKMKSCCASSTEQLSSSKPQPGGASQRGAVLGKSREVLTRQQNPTNERDPTEPQSTSTGGCCRGCSDLFYSVLLMERSQAGAKPGRMQNKQQQQQKGGFFFLSILRINTKIKRKKWMQTSGETKGN